MATTPIMAHSVFATVIMEHCYITNTCDNGGRDSIVQEDLHVHKERICSSGGYEAS